LENQVELSQGVCKSLLKFLIDQYGSIKVNNANQNKAKPIKANQGQSSRLGQSGSMGPIEDNQVKLWSVKPHQDQSKQVGPI
jgi:hypothetical protein